MIFISHQAVVDHLTTGWRLNYVITMHPACQGHVTSGVSDDWLW